jgi:hypothetical protein
MFTVEDFDSNMRYVDEAGNEIDEDMAKATPFIGTDEEALRESGDRAVWWEVMTGYLVSRVTRHSLGVVE